MLFQESSPSMIDRLLVEYFCLLWSWRERNAGVGQDAGAAKALLTCPPTMAPEAPRGILAQESTATAARHDWGTLLWTSAWHQMHLQEQPRGCHSFIRIC